MAQTPKQVKKQKKTKKKSYSESDIQAAIQYLRDEHTQHITVAARKFGVPYGTLRNRHLGLHKVANHAHEIRQHLTDTEEHVLCDWIEYRSDIGQPLTRKQLVKKVELCIGRKPSYKWLPRFLKRHPVIRLGKPSGLDPKRAQSFNRPVIEQYFDELKQALTEKSIPWRNVYNMDEKGCQ